MKENQREKGAYWEQKAGAYLESIGYEILEYNFRCRMGEIDIIARDGDYLVFCEVKYRAGTGKDVYKRQDQRYHNRPSDDSCH